MQNSYAFYVTYCNLCVSTELRAALFSPHTKT